MKNAIFDGADIVGANFNRANLQKANFSGAKVVRANFRLANLCAADLSGCDVDSSTKFADAKYDERTKLPADFSQLDSLLWKGKWPDPRIIARKERARAIGTIDFSEFIEHLQRNFDIARLKKTTQMLKKESFQLFSEVMPESVVGIVKSQTADDLVYSCQLTSDGNFCCATQNLNPCGGLKGALCKHILVLIIGLARSEKIDCQQAAQWVLMSKACAPKLNRETLTEVFLKYKGAQAGEIDWRPTETIPEDYYAF